jgi:hypothetical protein
VRSRMNASDYQLVAEAKLKQHFADVRHEWSVVKDASDAFACRRHVKTDPVSEHEN